MVAYVGQREVQGHDGPELVDAVWPPIIDPNLFDRVQALKATNGKTEHNAAKRIKLSRDLPKLRKRRETMTKQLAKVAATADKVLTEWSEVEAGRSFVEERLEQLSAQRDDLRAGIADLDRQIGEIETSGASAEAVREALSRVDEVYEHLKPHERKELFKLLLRSVEVGERQIVLEIYAGGTSVGAEAPDRQRLRGRLGWLPDEDSNLEPSG